MRVISFSFYFLFSFEVHATITKWPVKRCDGPPEFRKYKCITSRHCPGLCRNDPKQVCFLSVHCKGRDNACEGKKCGIEPSHTPSEAPSDKASYAPSDMTSSAPSDVPKQEFAKTGTGTCHAKNENSGFFEGFTTYKGTQVDATTKDTCLEKCRDFMKHTSISGCQFFSNYKGCYVLNDESFKAVKVYNLGKPDFCWIFN